MPSVVIGGLIAVGAGWVQAALSGRASREQFDREQVARRTQFEAEQQARRDDEVRLRADLKADEILQALNELDRWSSRRGYRAEFIPEGEDRAAVRESLAAVRGASSYLQKPTRQHVKIACSLLTDIDEMYHRHFLADAPSVAARTILQFARRSVANYLRGEPPPDVPDAVEGYRQRQADLLDYIDYLTEQQIAAHEAASEAPES